VVVSKCIQIDGVTDDSSLQLTARWQVCIVNNKDSSKVKAKVFHVVLCVSKELTVEDGVG
jgi:hypothetical protein